MAPASARSSTAWLDSEANYWSESLDSGPHDDLWTGDANLVFRFVQSPRVQMRTGLGMNWIADDLGSDFGFNFTYQGDLFPWKPWIISAELDLGTVGDETLVHGRITTGLQWKQAEVSWVTTTSRSIARNCAVSSVDCGGGSETRLTTRVCWYCATVGHCVQGGIAV